MFYIQFVDFNNIYILCHVSNFTNEPFKNYEISTSASCYIILIRANMKFTLQITGLSPILNFIKYIVKPGMPLLVPVQT